MFLAAGVSAPAQTAHKNSASACAGCHASQARPQPDTPMGRGMQWPDADPLFKSHPQLNFRKDSYTYTVETKGVQPVYSVTDGTRTISLPIHWSFGKGAQTWVLEKDGELYESMVSYYPSIDGLEITTGDSALTPQNLDEAVGRKLLKSEPKDCFGCHSTNAVSNGELTLQTLVPGVTCEHCHTGATAHMIAAVQSGEFGTAPPDLRKLSTEDISNFCGQCHRTWETVVRSAWRGEVDVRFQPYRLANSQCFDGTDPRISCIACHDPHQQLVTADNLYDGKCLACHAARSTSAPGGGHNDAKACSVASTNCVSCHMPKVKLPNGLVTFHDHEIRIVKPGAPYPD
ncbi:MAG: multiheme c-type cytochrome [Candidatus Sulfotelmatobacter sp.]